MRTIFSDGFNSAVHFFVGYCGKPLVIALGVAHQLATVDRNTLVDLAEMAIGYAFFTF